MADAIGANNVVDASSPSSAKAEVDETRGGDVENQLADGGDSTPPNGTSSSNVTALNVGIFAEDDDAGSVFSFESYEHQPRIPLRVQNIIRKQQMKNDNDNGQEPDNGAVPFPSVMGASMEYENVVNVCPCRCLFFTLKETICLTLSALGCMVYLALLICLILYLEGSLGSWDK